MRRYVIIGNSAGGIGAAEAIREIDEQGEITIVSDEPYHTYSRPCISEFLAGTMALESMYYRPLDFYERNRIHTLLGKRATRIDPALHTVELEDGSCLRWDVLLIATGGTPFLPPLEGGDKQGVLTFTRLDDAMRLRELLKNGDRAVVIGGGLIGVSVTEALARRGVHVTVVELKERILGLILDEDASRLAEAALQQAGVEIVTGQTVRRILGRKGQPYKVGGVELDDGRRFPCDAVVVAIGVVPRSELAKEAGLAVRRGVMVNEYMATSFPDVYACGDVAEAYDYIYEENRLTPIWPNAYIGGRVAGRNMAGVVTRYPGGTSVNALKYFGLSVISGGLVNVDHMHGCTVLRRLDAEHGVYRKLVLRDGRLVGLIFAGNIEGAGVAHGLMRRGTRVEEFSKALLADGFGLVSLPQQLRREMLQA